jgi:adenylate cyclase
MARAPRKLTVIVSLDLEGFSRLVHEDEPRTLARLGALKRDLVDSTLDEYRGRLFKTLGDGALIEFDSVLDAVEWTIAFQTAMKARNEADPSRAMAVRAAVVLADVVLVEEDRMGAAVGFATRMQEVAPPGGIVITHSVRWQLIGDVAKLFRPAGLLTVRSVDFPVESWIWTPDAGDEAAPDLTPEGVSRAIPYRSDRRPSIAVLPFDNLSGDPALDRVADGVVEEITATLSRIHDFTVIARNSAYVYKGQAVDIREAARALGVRYVLEGSIRKSGERLRVTAQLIDGETGRHLWAERFDAVSPDVFDLQERIAEQVAGALHPSIRAAEIEAARRKRPDSLAAYDLMLQALPHLWAHRQVENLEAIRLLDRALQLDPRYARAAALAAWAHAQMIVYSWTTDLAHERREGMRFVERAAEEVKDDPTALTAIASAIMMLSGDLDRAEPFIDRALALDGNHAWAWTRRGFFEVYRGRARDAFVCFERAMRLSPLDPFSFNSFIGMGLAHFADGRPAEAHGWTRRAMSEKPGMTWAYRDLAAFLAHAGEMERARAAMARLLETRPHLTAGHVEEALRFMEASLRARYVEGLRMAGLPD